MANIDITITGSKDEILSALKKNIEKGLKAVGSAAEGYAKEDCPVDTGRLRNSITFAVGDYQSPANTNKHPSGQTNAEPEDYELNSEPDENMLYIGTNVEYAPAVEYRDATHKTGKAHFLRDSIAKHSKEYKAILEAALKA